MPFGEAGGDHQNSSVVDVTRGRTLISGGVGTDISFLLVESFIEGFYDKRLYTVKYPFNKRCAPLRSTLNFSILDQRAMI